MDLDRELHATMHRRLEQPPPGRAEWGALEMKVQKVYVRRVVVGTMTAATLILVGVAVGAPLLAQRSTGVVSRPPSAVQRVVPLDRMDLRNPQIAWDGSNFVVALGPGRQATAGAVIADSGAANAIEGINNHAEDVVASPSTGHSYFFGLSGIRVVRSGTVQANVGGLFSSPAVDRSTGRLYAIEAVPVDGTVTHFRLARIDVAAGGSTIRSERLDIGDMPVRVTAAAGRVTVATANPDLLRVYDGDTLKLVATIGARGRPRAMVAASRADRLAVIIDGDRASLRVYRDGQQAPAVNVTLPFDRISGLAIDAKGGRIYTVAGEDLITINAENGEIVSNTRLFKGMETAGALLAYDDRNERLGVLLPSHRPARVVIVKL